MYRFKKQAFKFIKQCGYVFTYPAVVLYNCFQRLEAIGIGGFFSGALLLWCIYQAVQSIRQGQSAIFAVGCYFVLYTVLGTFGASLLESVLHLFIKALVPVKVTNENLKKSMQETSRRTLEKYIYEMRHQKSYSTKKVGM